MSQKQAQRECDTARLVSEFMAKYRRENLNPGEAERRTGITRTTFANWQAGRLTKRMTDAVMRRVREYLPLDDLPFDASRFFSDSVRAAKMGIRNPRWNGGASQYPDHAELKRRRLDVLRIARGKCSACEGQAEVVHHIDGDKSNHSMENLAALCKPCHWAIHNSDGAGTRSSKYSKKYGMTLRELSESLGVSHSIVYAFLRGRRNFDPVLLAKLEQIKPVEGIQ